MTKHVLTPSAFPIVGFRSPSKPRDTYSETDAELRNGGAVIGAGTKGLVSIRNEDEKTSLHALLTSLIDCLKKFQVNTNTGLVIPAIVTELEESIKQDQLNKLLR